MSIKHAVLAIVLVYRDKNIFLFSILDIHLHTLSVLLNKYRDYISSVACKKCSISLHAQVAPRNRGVGIERLVNACTYLDLQLYILGGDD